MSYGTAAALQTALFQRLTGDAALGALVGGNIYDAVPPGAVPDLYVLLGEEDVRDRSDKTGAGALHEVTVSVISAAPGFAAAKAAAAAVSDTLLAPPPPPLARGRIAGVWFLRAQARRLSGEDRRRIALKFRLRTEDD
ncbi:DUF3168 domain-containing protein [Rhodobacteraceae bacterium CCMM004]|nr:DUF3168 domain-containing protein [Rhodobacteraceae bacterium CCMM004]